MKFTLSDVSDLYMDLGEIKDPIDVEQFPDPDDCGIVFLKGSEDAGC